MRHDLAARAVGVGLRQPMRVKRCVRAGVVAGVAWLCLTQAILAVDNLPPSWRGQPGTTFQRWDFLADTNPATPDLFTNPFGSAVANIAVGPQGTGWWMQLPGFGNQTGYWDIGGEGGEIVVSIANQVLPHGYREVWVQITYWRDISDAPVVTVMDAAYQSQQTAVVESVITGGHWLCNRSYWRLEPGPESDGITIIASPAWGTIVESIVVDTLAVSTPSICHTPLQDIDGDGDVDADDLLVFAQCASGPSLPFQSTDGRCACFDQDADGDVDQVDFAAFQRSIDP